MLARLSGLTCSVQSSSFLRSWVLRQGIRTACRWTRIIRSRRENSCNQVRSFSFGLSAEKLPPNGGTFLDFKIVLLGIGTRIGFFSCKTHPGSSICPTPGHLFLRASTPSEKNPSDFACGDISADTRYQLAFVTPGMRPCEAISRN